MEEEEGGGQGEGEGGRGLNCDVYTLSVCGVLLCFIRRELIDFSGKVTVAGLLKLSPLDISPIFPSLTSLNHSSSIPSTFTDYAV